MGLEAANRTCGVGEAEGSRREFWDVEGLTSKGDESIERAGWRWDGLCRGVVGADDAKHWC